MISKLCLTPFPDRGISIILAVALSLIASPSTHAECRSRGQTCTQSIEKPLDLALTRYWRAGPSGHGRATLPPSPPIFTDEMIQDMKDGLMNSFLTPWEDLMKKAHPSELRNLLTGLSTTLSANYPLDQSVTTTQGSGSQGNRSGKTPTLNATVKYNPLSYWFATATFTRFLDKALQAPWNGDFVYSFGYNDWHPYTLSAVYSNFGGNRLFPDRSKGERVTALEEGTINVGWKFPLPQRIADWVTFEEGTPVNCSTNLKVTPRFTDLATSSTKKWKTALAFGCKVPIFSWWYVNWNVNWWPDKDQQQPWDPDFTYGFGYFDWHPGTISVQYNNYAANRFPWNRNKSGNGRFKDGSISVSWSRVY